MKPGEAPLSLSQSLPKAADVESSGPFWTVNCTFSGHHSEPKGRVRGSHVQPQTKRQPEKPFLDEQAFQRLLSAAYVMQEHNARLKKNPAPVNPPKFEVVPLPKAQPAPEPPVAADPIQSAGSTSQKNWASLWEMHHRPDTTSASDEPPAATPNASPVEDEEALFPSDLEEIVEKFGHDDEAAVEPSATKPSVPAENAPHRILEETALVKTPAKSIASAQASTVPATSSSPWVSARNARAWLESLRTDKAKSEWLRRQWRESRGNFYIAGASVVLLVVLIQWFTTPPPQPNGGPRQLSPVEQLMVKMGVAEAPPTPQEYNGNPNTKVWVDVRTGLYYCPGAELYGKSKEGKVTTQLDAQRDQFQPSTLKPCD